MKIYIEQDDSWTQTVSDAANVTVEALRNMGLSPDQIGMAAVFVLARLVEANASFKDAGLIQIVSHRHDEERAAIVEWLRSLGEFRVDKLADAIEEGEHAPVRP